MRFGLYANLSIGVAVEVSRRVLRALEGEEMVLETEIARRLGMDGCPLREMDVDILVTVGGDGTILRALQRSDAPILGVNAGVVGFLTEVPAEGIEDAVRRIKEGGYWVEERSKLKTVLEGERLADGINEAVVHTATIAKIRHFNIFVNGQLATEVRSDGVIVATPTGSTCYAMSVGAPIIDPKVEAFVFVPMAPYKFAARPVVVPSSSVITVELVLDKPCVLVIDGQEEYRMEGRSKVEFSLSENVGRFIRFQDDFYERMREKLICAL